MFLIPITGKTSRRNLPFITISLVVINVIVFFAFQRNDNKYILSAEKYYYESGLAKIELSSYLAYKKTDGRIPVDERQYENLVEKMKINRRAQLRNQMIKDSIFMDMLRTKRIIQPENPRFGQWNDLKLQYEQKLDRSVTFRFGLRPALVKAYTFFTYMFLHGSFGHLLGNMIFLWLVGCMLEMGCGRLYYIILYVITGITAAIVFWLIYQKSLIPLIGASGAIAGLMGAFALLYGRKKVKIFFSLGFYFGYRQIAAILLLPLWIGNEFYQLFFGGVSHVAYVGHIGGLVSGAILGFVNLKMIGAYDADALAPEPVDDIAPIIETALDHFSRLEMEEGCYLLEEVLKKDPSHEAAMTHLFNVLKLTPENDRFHHISRRLLNRLTQNAEAYEDALRIHGEYKSATNQQKLSSDIYIRLSNAYSAAGFPEESERMLTAVLKRNPKIPGISNALLKLAQSYHRKGKQDLHNKCLRIIAAKYPDSHEAHQANRVLVEA
jgi:membrane associated rhomboid family serine protease